MFNRYKIAYDNGDGVEFEVVDAVNSVVAQSVIIHTFPTCEILACEDAQVQDIRLPILVFGRPMSNAYMLERENGTFAVFFQHVLVGTMQADQDPVFFICQAIERQRLDKAELDSLVNLRESTPMPFNQVWQAVA